MLSARPVYTTALAHGRRYLSTPHSPLRREFKVVLDNDTLYVEQALAEALGWKAGAVGTESVPLTLSGWSPHYFAIAKTGSDAGAPYVVWRLYCA